MSVRHFLTLLDLSPSELDQVIARASKIKTDLKQGIQNYCAQGKVMTMIYFADGAKLKAPQNDNQKADWEAWLPGAEIGKVIDTPLNPVL